MGLIATVGVLWFAMSWSATIGDVSRWAGPVLVSIQVALCSLTVGLCGWPDEHPGRSSTPIVQSIDAGRLPTVDKRIPGRRFFRRPKPFAGSEVWIVQHDESPDNTVLGVFATDDEAYAFMDTVKDDYENGVICSSFAIPYRSTDQVVRYQSED